MGLKPYISAYIRPATAADLFAINEIYNHYVACSTCTYQESPTPMEERHRWFESHGPNHPIIVAELAGEVIGFGSLSAFHQRSGYRFTVENSVYIRRDRVGRGIGSAILADLIARARVVGHHAVIAVIDGEQAASIRLHERHGFVRCGHMREAGFKLGRWLDVVYLECLLSDNPPDNRHS